MDSLRERKGTGKVANPNGRPTVPYRSRVIRLPDTGEAGRAFLAAYFDAMKRAAETAERWKTDEGRAPDEWEDAAVYLYRVPDGAWRVSPNWSDVPEDLHERTETVLMVYADGDVSIGR
jgi:hypothetical protein